jgi:Tfp pilus assembly ATPase PilU
LDRTDSNAILSVVSKDLEQSLQAALNLAAEYAGVQPPEVVIDRDMNFDPLDGTGMTAINTLFQSGLIDHKTALEMLKRGEVLGDDMEIDEVMAQAEAEELQSMEQEMQKLEATAEIAAKNAPPQAAPKNL